ncbi:CoA pyrophosphatase, partial [Acinetobacter baumannii]|nr:CoA pyrophosphatase [Acinetobacter baumannii]
QQLIETRPTPYEVRYAHQSLYFPSLQIDNEIIWGLTARMLIALFKYGLGYQKEWPFLLNAPTFGMPKFSHKK